MEELFNWAFDNGGVAVAFAVNTAILVYVLKSIDNKLDRLNITIEKFIEHLNK